MFPVDDEDGNAVRNDPPAKESIEKINNDR